MDVNQKIIIDLLSCVLRKRVPDESIVKGAEWNALWKEARAHDISAMLYPALKNLTAFKKQSKELQDKWQRSALVAASMQSYCFMEIVRVFEAFKENGISVIALKGLILRKLYPQPELRTMGDADILVHNEDLGRVRDLLTTMGYTPDSDNEVHIHFNHPNCLPIEVHWSLINERFVKGAEKWEKTVWENSVPADGLGGSALMLSLEDHILHLCLHMAVHIMHSGFGLRQLCDLVLLIESASKDIDWDLFCQKAKFCRLERFTWAILQVCSKFFNLEVPEPVKKLTHGDSKYIQLLEYDVFSSGTYGNKTSVRQMGNLLLRDENYKNSDPSAGKLKYYFKLAFPSSLELGEKYNYARRHPILLPAAWIQRLIRSLYRKDLSISDKLALPELYGNRAKLIDWLNLK
ncbi:MAG: nucleotidyltransferase family protein [Clostridia bacterium]|nr:nucleotidyltransferase family protein [Clostridia bacterium]